MTRKIKLVWTDSMETMKVLSEIAKITADNNGSFNVVPNAVLFAYSKQDENVDVKITVRLKNEIEVSKETKFDNDISVIEGMVIDCNKISYLWSYGIEIETDGKKKTIFRF